MDISNAAATITTTVITAHMPHLSQLDTETALHIIIAICSVAVVMVRAHQ